MLDETIDIFISRMKDIVLKDKNMPAVPLAYLQTLDIPDSVMHFFNQEVEILLREEETKFESDRFDYDQPEVRMLIDQIFDRLQQNAVFDLNRFNHLLERAIKLELTYVVQPHWTLTQFIFKDGDTVSTIEVYDTLKYFFKFEYYKNAISDYFNTKYLKSVKRDQFADLIQQIDQKALEENTLETTLKTVKSIMSAFEDARQTDVNSLSLEILIDTMSDRGLDDYANLLKKAQKETKLSELSFNEIEHLLKDGTMPGAEVAAEEEAEEATIENYENIEESAPEVDVESIEVKESSITEEIAEEEEEEEEEYDEEEEEKEEEAANANVASDLADHVASQISSDTPLEDLNNMIVGRGRRKIVKRLFKKKEDEFNSFVEALNNETSWKIASKIIDDEFYDREINPYSKEAISLSDIIYLRFFPKDKYVGEQEN